MNSPYEEFNSPLGDLLTFVADLHPGWFSLARVVVFATVAVAVLKGLPDRVVHLVLIYPSGSVPQRFFCYLVFGAGGLVLAFYLLGQPVTVVVAFVVYGLFHLLVNLFVRVFRTRRGTTFKPGG